MVHCSRGSDGRPCTAAERRVVGHRAPCLNDALEPPRPPEGCHHNVLPIVREDQTYASTSSLHPRQLVPLGGNAESVRRPAPAQHARTQIPCAVKVVRTTASHASEEPSRPTSTGQGDEARRANSNQSPPHTLPLLEPSVNRPSGCSVAVVAELDLSLGLRGIDWPPAAAPYARADTTRLRQAPRILLNSSSGICSSSNVSYSARATTSPPSSRSSVALPHRNGRPVSRS